MRMIIEKIKEKIDNEAWSEEGKENAAIQRMLGERREEK